jgi:chemotaxis protein CheZ
MSEPEQPDGAGAGLSRSDTAPGCPGVPGAGLTAQSRDELLSGVGQLTRKLHEILRELGYDRDIERAAHAAPDARQRLDYLASITEQAATRSLTAVETARPLQEQLGSDAQRLILAWERFFTTRLRQDALWQLAEDTCRFLEGARTVAQVTGDQLIEILMAQEFQDLTGQVIRKLIHAVHDLEQQLLKLLLDQTPALKRQQCEDGGLLNGPVIATDGRPDVVTSQQQVDDLLESLGF